MLRKVVCLSVEQLHLKLKFMRDLTRTSGQTVLLGNFTRDVSLDKKNSR